MSEAVPAISVRHQDADSFRSYSCQAMACPFNFHLRGESDGLLDSAVMEAEERLAQIEERLSLYIEHSDTTRINRAKAGEVVRLSQDTVDCLRLGFDASAQLAGKFNPFLGQSSIDKKGQRNGLLHLHGLKQDDEKRNDPVISLDESTNSIQKLREGPLLDLGGIGKGFALDRLRELFLEWEIEQGLIDAGGSTYLAMKPPLSALAWNLTIGYGDTIKTVKLEAGQVLASSGEMFQGNHVIDPDTGSTRYPWKRSYAKASSGALADAASTAALLLDTTSLASIVGFNNDLSFALFSDTESFTWGDFLDRPTTS